MQSRPQVSTMPGSSNPSSDEWPMFRGALNHTGVSRTTAVQSTGLTWNDTIGESIESSPAVASGRVYVGCDDHNIYCFDATNGMQIWSYTTGRNVDSSPAIADGRVYIGSDDGNLYCLNETTGERVWNYTTGSNVKSSPAVAGGYVYFGSDDWKVYCLNATTGKLAWSFTTAGVVRSSPAVVAGWMYIGANDGELYCFNATTGYLVWSHQIGAAVVSSFAIAEGLLYVATDKLYCFNATTNALIWSYSLYPLDFWSIGQHEPAGYTSPQLECSPAVAGGRVYVGGYDRNFYCMNALTGDVYWNYTTSNIVYSSPAIAGGCVYIQSYDGNIYCFDTITGELDWNYSTWKGNDYPNSESSPVATGGHLFICGGNQLYCFPMILFALPSMSTITIMIMLGVFAGIAIIAGTFVIRKRLLKATIKMEPSSIERPYHP